MSCARAVECSSSSEICLVILRHLPDVIDFSQWPMIILWLVWLTCLFAGDTCIGVRPAGGGWTAARCWPWASAGSGGAWLGPRTGGGGGGSDLASSSCDRIFLAPPGPLVSRPSRSGAKKRLAAGSRGVQIAACAVEAVEISLRVWRVGRMRPTNDAYMCRELLGWFVG